MDNDLDSMRDLWRQFRRMLVKKVSDFNLFREAALHELTPDWFQARYGSVWQHAFVLIKNLWLFLGVLAISSSRCSKYRFGTTKPFVPSTFDLDTHDDEIRFRETAIV